MVVPPQRSPDMAVHKRKRNGKVTWYYKFDLPGSSRADRRMVREFGFATQKAAIDAEAKRRIEEQEKSERVEAGSVIAAPLPKTLKTLLDEFLEQHVDRKLAAKTRERYHDQAAMLDPGLLDMAVDQIEPMHLSREWNRLLAQWPLDVDKGAR